MRMDQRKEVNEMSDDMQKDAVLTAVELMRHDRLNRDDADSYHHGRIMANRAI